MVLTDTEIGMIESTLDAQQNRNKLRKIDPKEIATMVSLRNKFIQIEEKNKCVRVQFLDWLSEKLEKWSKMVKNVANNIHSPCIIKMPPAA